RSKELQKRNIDYVIRAREKLGSLDNHHVEDLIGALRFGTWKAVGKRTVQWKDPEPYVPIAALTSDIDDQVVLYNRETYGALNNGSSLHLTDQEVFAWQDVKHVPKTASSAENDVPPDVSKQLTVLLAGHDFKFFSEISTSIRQAGHRIIVDHWESHTDHDEESSRRLLAEADVIFCEWSLGNIRWYSHNKLPGQKLVTRFHAQELRTKFLREADINNIDTF